MKKISAPALSLLSILASLNFACGEKKKSDDASTSATSLRSVAANSFTSVGMVTVSGKLRCSGLILKHGVFATAKHCFTADSPAANTLGLIFTATSGIVDDNSVRIASTSMQELNLDGDGNDIAYIIYDAATTSDAVTLTTTNIITEAPAAGTPMSLVGFPSPSDRTYRKLASMPCQRLERKGTIEPNDTDPLGYDGILYDTDCGAWFGNSGGPLFVMDKTDPSKVLGTVGVVTHTFDIDSSGDILDSALTKDTYGTYVKTVNFSSYGSANTLEENLAKGE